VIDTGFIIDGMARLESTKKIPVLIEAQSDYKLVVEAPEGSRLNRLFGRRLKQKGGVFLVRKEAQEQDMAGLTNTGLRDHFMFMELFAVLYTMTLCSSFFPQLFFKRTAYHETIAVTYVRKNLEEAKKERLLRT
jgi:hypothetical protein